jgi:hypothetical protein
VSRPKSPPREIPFAEIEERFTLASYWFGAQWCPAVQKYERGTYSIRVSRGESLSRGSRTDHYDYFELAADGTVDTAPRGYAKDFKPGRVVDIEVAVLRYAQPDVARPTEDGKGGAS